MRRLIDECRRRKIFRTAAAYLIVAWLVLQVIETIGPAVGLPDWVLPFAVVSLALGMPVALVLAWFYAITPTGIKLESEVTGGTQWVGGRLSLILIGMLAAALIVSLLVRRPAEVASDVQSLAVLPLTNISGDPEDDAFVAGLHEDLLTQLSHIKSMQVVSRTSVMRYAETELPVTTIAAQLGVASVLEGSVQRDGQRLRVQMQLIDGRSDRHLWADSFDRRLTASDVFAIQRDIATAVTRALSAQMSPRDERRLATPPTENFEAYSAYLFAKQKIEQRTSDTLDQAVELLRRAISLDPSFAEAHAQLAMAYDLASWYGDLSREDMLLVAMPAAQRALALDPELPEAWTALADLRVLANDDAGAEEAFRKAIEFSPNYPVALHWYGLQLLGRGDYDAALQLHQRALALDPMSITLTNSVALDLFCLDRKDEALAHYERSIELDPNFAATHAHLANIYAYGYARPDEAARWLVSAAQLDRRHTEYPSQMAMLLVDLDDPELALAWAQRALELGERRVWPNRAMVRVSERLGDETKLVIHAERLLAAQPGSWVALRALRDVDLAAGRVETARARYAVSYPELFGTPPEITEANYGEAIDLARVLIALGDTARARTLLENVRPLVDDPGKARSGPAGIYFADIELLAMLGETEAALTRLEAAAQNDWTESWWQAAATPNLETLHEHPRFIAAIARLRERAAEFRGAVDVPMPAEDR